MWRWGKTRGKWHARGVSIGTAATAPSGRRTLSLIASIGLVAGLLSFPVQSEPPAFASGSLESCRVDAGVSNDPYPRYVSSTSRSDTVNGIRIVPVYAPTLYIDPRNNYDASYIAYRITNNSGSTQKDLRLSLENFTGEVRLANSLDKTARIGDLANGAQKTLYFLVTAKRDSGASTHEVRLTTGPTSSRVAACEATIEAVERSIAASPNRVTSIDVDTDNPVLGDTIKITVDGVPGNVPRATSDPFFSIMTLSPASSSTWPTRALRLEEAKVVVKGIASNNAHSACAASGGANVGGTQNTIRTSTFTNTLVIVNFGACATNVKQTYTSTYTFRVIAPTQTNPVIRPLADITSGQKVKYTGSLPVADTSVSLTETTVPLKVTKSASSTHKGFSVEDGYVDIEYSVTASSTGGEVTIDAIIDKPDSKVNLADAVQSAVVSDAKLTNVSISHTVIGDRGEIRFDGPFTATVDKPAVITYVMRIPLGESVTNQAFGLSGSFVIGSSATQVDGVKVQTSADGGSVTVTAESTPTDAPKVEQSVIFSPLDPLGEGDSVVLSAFSDAGLPVTYAVSDDSVCIIVEVDGLYTLFALVASEDGCEVTATQAGTATYAPADSTQVVVIRGGQRLEVEDQTDFTNKKATVTVSATSGLVPTLQSIDEGVCTIDNPESGTDRSPPAGARLFSITEMSSGTCLLAANQAGNETFAPAPEVDIIIGAGKPQTIAFVSPDAGSSQTGGVGNTFNVVANAKDGTTALSHVIDFESLTPTVCQVVVEFDSNGDFDNGYVNNTPFNTTRKISTLSAGTCTIRATQDGFDHQGEETDYRPTSATRSFTITSGSTVQVIEFLSPPTNKTYGDAAFQLFAVSNKSLGGEPTNLLVTLEGSGACTSQTSVFAADSQSRTTVTLTGAGTCTITATQSGDFTYQAATPEVWTIAVGKKPLNVTGLSVPSRVYDGTTSAAIEGTPSLSGVVPGDNSSAISLVGTATGQFNSPDVGANVPVTVATNSLSLDGSKKDSYTLTLPSLSGEITQRALVLKPDSVTLIEGERAPETCAVSAVDDTSLAAGDSIKEDSVLCLYNNETPEKLQNAAGSFTIQIMAGSEAPVIERAGDPVTGNYSVTYQDGTLIVQDEDEAIALENIDDLVLIYGEPVPEDFLTEPVAKKKGQRVSGDIVHRLPNGNALTAGVKLPATPASGVTITVEFKETGSSAQVTASRKITVNKRPVTFDPGQLERVYDGTTTFTTSSVPVTSIDGEVSGVVDGENGDPEEVFVAFSGDGELDSPNEGTRAVSWPTAPALGGAAAGNYVLRPPNVVTVSVTKRPIKITATSGSTLLGDPISENDFDLVINEDPTDSDAVNRGLAPGQQLDDVLLDYTVTLPSPSAVGSFDVTPDIRSSNGNYDIQAASGTLYVADIQVAELKTVNGVVTEPTFTCTCEGLAPNTAVTVLMFSDPVNLTENVDFTTDANGNCPDDVEFTIPEEIFVTPDGGDPNHTIEVSGFFPTDDLGGDPQAVRSTAVTMGFASAPPADTPNIGDTTPTPDNGGSTSPGTGNTTPTPGNGGSTPGGSTSPGTESLAPPPLLPAPQVPSVTTPNGSASAPSRPPRPVEPPLLPELLIPTNPISPSPPGQSQTTVPLAPAPADSSSNAGGLPGQTGSAPGDSQSSPSSLSGQARSPLGQVAQRAQDPSNTFDLGVEGLSPAELVGNGSSARAGTRSVGEMREEKLGGFDPGTALRVEVIGSRTTARFVISTLTGLDELVLIEQITRSSEGNRTGFAGVDRIGIGSPTGPQNPWSLEERDSAYDLFNYSRLDAPTKQSDQLGSSSYTWLNIEKGVNGYLPGSTIYLTATSSPVVFGETQVGPDGKATVNGDLAVELLGLGEHRIRVIGTRVFEDIQVDADGEVIIPDFVLEQILLFDMGTDATVIVTGNNPTGGVHTVMRVVPLDPVSPWWTLWVIAWTALLLLLARLRGMIRTFMEKSVAGGAVLVSSIPALYLGWTTTVTQVAWWGLLMGVGLSLAVWFVPSLRREHPQVGDRLA